MWDKALFVLRRLTVDLGPLLGSWRLSIVLMVLAVQYYVFLAIWAGSSPPHVVRNIASMIPFWLVYAALLLNTGVCLWRRIPGLRLDLARGPRWAGRPPDWSVVAPAGVDANGARRLLEKLGYRVAWEREGAVGGYRRRWAALGTYLFHGAFFVLAVGFLLSLLTRQEARAWAAVGEEFRSQPDQFLSQALPAGFGAGIPDIRFRVDRIFPEFWRDQFLFTTLEADLVLPGGKRKTTRINRPLWLSFGTFLRLSGFGYAPRYELVDRDGRVIDSAYIKLNLFPPGQRDYFRLPDYPHRFYLQVYPDLDGESAVAATRTLNLVEPGIVLQVFRGRLDLGASLLLDGEGFEFEGLTLRFPEIRYWGEFSIVRNSGAPLLFLGYVVGLSGLLIRLGGRRRELEWYAGSAGGPGRMVGWGGGTPRRLSRAYPPSDDRGAG